MAEERHRKEEKRPPPPEGPEGPAGGVTRQNLTNFAIKILLALLLALLVKGVEWLLIWLTALM